MNVNSAALVLVCSALLSTTAHGQVLHFTSRAAQPNDVSNQTIQCDLDAERTIRQHNQVVDTSKQVLRRLQVRTVTVLDTIQGTAARAKISYALSTTKVKAGNNGGVEAKQPVEGNTYIISRKGEELLIVRENGESITEEEDKILRAQLSTFGKPNPLSQFLNGKRIQVGAEIDVPNEVAAELLGLTGNKGKTDGLTLKLAGLKSIDGTNCAVFETLLRSHSDESSITLLMKGELIIDPKTCRTHSIKLHGPVAISELKGPSIARFTVSTNGSLKVVVSNDHSSTVPTTAKRRSLFRNR